LTGGIAPYGTYLSEDGAPISLGALEPKFWASFCQGVGLPFDPAVFVPGPHQAAWKQRVADIFRSRTHRAWQAFSEDHDCCLEPVLRADEVLRDPHLNARGMFFEIETNEGPIGQFRTPVTPRPQDHSFAPPPRPGEHTDAILLEAGFSPERIAGLRAGGAVR
jgi:crotonobetainyl-CoA:carnitine CoA-transferase CaiB-like acyl-CoA transferase